MPSSVDPSNIATGPGKIHVDVVSAAAELFSSSSSAIVGSLANALSQQISVSVVSAHFTGSNNTTQLLTVGPFFVGDSNWISTPADHTLADLFRVVDATTDAEIYNATTGLFLQVSSISPASVGSGFFSGNLTLTFNTNMPTGVVYKIYYGRQVTVGSLPEAMNFPDIRRSMSADPISFFPFIRDRAPVSQAGPLDIISNAYLDAYMAQWKGTFKGTIGSGNPFPSQSGSAGFVYVGRKQNIGDANDESYTGTHAAAFLSVYEKNIKASTLLGLVPWSKVNSGLAATLNPGGAGADMVQLNAADYFRLTGPDRTAIRLGVDMLEVTFSTGVKASYVISFFDNSDITRARLLTLGGATPTFTSNTAVTVKWIRTGFFTGGDNDYTAGTDVNFLYAGTGHYVPGAITEDPTQEWQQWGAFYGAGTMEPVRRDNGRGGWNIEALAWGGHAQSGISPAGGLGSRVRNGALWGDGSVQSYGGHITGLHNKRFDFGDGSGYVISTNTRTITWNPFVGSSALFEFQGTNTKVLTLLLDSAYLSDMQPGDEVTFLVRHTGTGASRSSTIVWPSQFIFSGNDSDVTTTVSDTVVPVFKFMGTTINGSFYLHRVDFEV